MARQTREPTPSEIMAEVKSVKSMVMNQGKTLKNHGGRLDAIDARHEKIDIGKAAVDEFKKAQEDEKNRKLAEETGRTKLKLLRDLSPLIAGAAALLYALAQSFNH